jgi:hypothetical protein
MDKGPISFTHPGTYTLGTFSIPGTTKGLGPWVYAYSSWTDGFGVGSDGQLTTALTGDCSIPDKKVNICHRDQGNPEWKLISISENALPAHLAHQWGADIYPVPSTGCPLPPPVIVHPTATATQACGTATVTFTNGTKYAFAGDIRVDNEAPSHVNYYGLGDFYQIVNIPSYGSISKTFTFDEDTGDHTVAFRIGLGAESDWYVPWQTLTISSDCIPPQPEALVSYTEWTDTTQNCDSQDVTQTRDKSVTQYTLIEGEWVAGTPTVTHESQTRAMTVDELAVCAGPQPKAEVTSTSESTKDCSSQEIATTVTTTTVNYIMDTETNTWIKGEPVITTDTTTEKTSTEDCPIAVELPTPKALAYTGSDSGWLIWPAGALLLAGAGIILITRLKRTA